MGAIENQKQDVLRAILAMRKDLEDRYTARRIGVYGSFARGEADKASGEGELAI